jgi:hypothetical protein
VARERRIEYDDTVRPADTEMALKTVKPALFPDETRAWAVDFSGQCPRCGDDIHAREWLVAVAGARRVNDQQMEQIAAQLDELGLHQPSGDESFDVTCSCAVHHPGAPELTEGCGARFRVRVIWP